MPRLLAEVLVLLVSTFVGVAYFGVTFGILVCQLTWGLFTIVLHPVVTTVCPYVQCMPWSVLYARMFGTCLWYSMVWFVPYGIVCACNAVRYVLAVWYGVCLKYGNLWVTGALAICQQG